VLTFVAFIFALSFAYDSASYGNDDDNLYGYGYGNGENNNNNNNNNQNNEWVDDEPVIAITSQAMSFAALWTAIVASFLGVYGTVVLGVVSPNGTYYACCAQAVHRSTPVGIGAFIGSLFMFSNMTLVSAVIFGEFHVRDYYMDGERGRSEDNLWIEESNLENSSKAFSGLCAFLTVMYAGFSMIVFMFSSNIIQENAADMEEELKHGGEPSKTGNYVGPDSHVI